MTTLHDRLTDLAQDAPAGPPVPQLWDRGVRYRRRRRLGTCVVLLAAVLALASLTSLSWVRARQDALPVGSPGALPDQLYAPSPWLPDTAGHPLGRLAAVIRADRHTWSGASDRELVGVSATSGAYRFLDLPHLAGRMGGSFALSPDGRFLAYLYQAGGLSGGPEATGIALYDASTDQTRMQPLRDGRGVQLAHDNLVWAGDDAVVLAWDSPDVQQVADNLVAWNVNVDTPTVLTPRGAVVSIEGAGPGFVVVASAEDLVVADAGTGAVLRTLSAGIRGSQQVFSPDAQRYVARTTDPEALVVGTLVGDAGHAPTYADVPGVDLVDQVLAWVDSGHVAVRRSVNGVSSVQDLDIATGATVHQVILAPGQGGEVQVATDLLAQPTVRGIRPSRPLDPRLVAGGAVAIVLAAGGVLITWRRRVRP